MSDFLKKFLLEDARRLSPSGRYAGLAAFGKHPGWDDHVEDLGLETESLNLAKTVFYVNGIGGQIDAGAWEKLEPAQQLPGFKHVFVWQRDGQMLVGRLWSSSDGKGRKRYPMVVCAHFTGVTLGWALKTVLPVLAELEEDCRKATTAEEVRALLSRRRTALREAIQGTDGAGEYAPVSPQALNRILKGGAGTEGFLRVLYQIENQASSFAVNRGAANVSPAEFRVPSAGENPEQALLFWTRFFQTRLDAAVPLLLVLPLEATWVDVTAGEPESHQFFCLRATPKAVPLVSEVPYNLDEAFRARARSFLDGFERGETTAAIPPPAASPLAAAPAPAGGGALKWLVLGVLLVAAIVLAVIFLTKGEKPPTSGQSPPASGVTNLTPPPAPRTETPKPAPPVEKTPAELAAEAARAAEAKKNADALAAAAKLKADAEAEALERERQQAEAARQQELEEKRKTAEAAAAAKKKAEEEAAAAAAAAAPKSNPPVAAAVGAALSAGRGGPTDFTNSIGMALVRLPSGLIVGKFEVTQGEYRKVTGNNPSRLIQDDNHPVQWVTRDEALEFCRKLTEMEQGSLGAAKYSLPTEAQWLEFRGDQKFEDIAGVTNKSTTAVGTFRPANKFGLFDVLGNVWEWSLDAPPEKLLKGGAYNSERYEQPAPPGNNPKGSNCGFRCVVVPR